MSAVRGDVPCRHDDARLSGLYRGLDAVRPTNLVQPARCERDARGLQRQQDARQLARGKGGDMAKYSMMVSGYLPSHIQMRTRTREAVRDIRRLAVDPLTKKKLMAEWFRIHDRAAPLDGQKRQGYLDLLGTEFYKKSKG